MQKLSSVSKSCSELEKMNKPLNLNAFKTRNDRFSYIFIYLNQ